MLLWWCIVYDFMCTGEGKEITVVCCSQESVNEFPGCLSICLSHFGGFSCSCRWEEGGKLQSQWGGLPSQWHLETRTLSRVRLWQRRHCLWWDTVRGPVKLWEGCHARGRVLPCVRQLRKCQQDDRWDRFTCIQKRDGHFVLDLHPL